MFTKEITSVVEIIRNFMMKSHFGFWKTGFAIKGKGWQKKRKKKRRVSGDHRATQELPKYLEQFF